MNDSFNLMEGREKVKRRQRSILKKSKGEIKPEQAAMRCDGRKDNQSRGGRDIAFTFYL